MTVVIARSRGLYVARREADKMVSPFLRSLLSKEEADELYTQEFEKAAKVFCLPVDGVFQGKDELLHEEVCVAAKPHPERIRQYFLCPFPLQQPVEDMPYEFGLKCLLAMPSLARDLTSEEIKQLPVRERFKGRKKLLSNLVDQIIVRTNQEQDLKSPPVVGIEYVVPEMLYDVVRRIDVLEARFGVEMLDEQYSRFLAIVKRTHAERNNGEEDGYLSGVTNDDGKLVMLKYAHHVLVRMQSPFYSRGATMVCRVKRKDDNVLAEDAKKFFLGLIKTAQELYESENAYRFHDLMLRVKV